MLEVGDDAVLFMKSISDKYLNPDSINNAGKEIFRFSKTFGKLRVYNACKRNWIVLKVSE